MPTENEPQKESKIRESKGILVGKVEDIEIIRPKTLAMPLSEGTHLQVREEGVDRPWHTEEIKPLLKTSFFALPTAKVIVGSTDLPDLWANVHFNARPFLSQGMNVYGRSPYSENGLGKPVYIRETEEEQLPPDTIRRLRTAFSEVLPHWYGLYRQMNLFPEGFSELPKEDLGYQREVAKYEAQGEQVLLVTNKNVIVNVGNPHVQGLHLVVHSRGSYWQKEGHFRGWEFPMTPKEAYQHIQGFLEMCGILLSLERILLQDEKLPFYNPEVHFSGNWGVKKEDLPESFSGSTEEWLTYCRTEEYKRKVWMGDDWAITNHGHLYATDTEERMVHLPRRPFVEQGMDWQNITPIGQAEVGMIAEVLKARLPEYIEEHAAGYISEPTTEDQETKELPAIPGNQARV